MNPFFRRNNTMTDQHWSSSCVLYPCLSLSCNITTAVKISMNTIHQSTFCFYISEPKTNPQCNPTEAQIWFQFEGQQATKEPLGSISDIDDLKRMALKRQENRGLYQAFYRNREWGPGEKVPLNTTSDQPVILRKINQPQPTESSGKLLLPVHIATKSIVNFLGASSVRHVEHPVVPKPVRKCLHDIDYICFRYFLTAS